MRCELGGNYVNFMMRTVLLNVSVTLMCSLLLQIFNEQDATRTGHKHIHYL